ncbi:flowering-promoting factor 1-like protein 3 [Selaginella moellendorffii]|nr:flowering-promoting factor 1-like protein 3 [Selaginella moellendorffii]|eukprot:XP_002968264.2 flowering-promoting factor 1-like protein 3 [Selaginella moellendorffii]
MVAPKMPSFEDGEIGENGEDPRDARVKKVLIFKTTGEIISSYDRLESKLFALGWHRYTGELEPMLAFDRERKQYFHPKPGSCFISLPLDFDKLRIIHLYGIVVQTRTAFAIREIPQPRRRGG